MKNWEVSFSGVQNVVVPRIMSDDKRNIRKFIFIFIYLYLFSKFSNRNVFGLGNSRINLHFDRYLIGQNCYCVKFHWSLVAGEQNWSVRDSIIIVDSNQRSVKDITLSNRQ